MFSKNTKIGHIKNDALVNATPCVHLKTMLPEKIEDYGDKQLRMIAKTLIEGMLKHYEKTHIEPDAMAIHVRKQGLFGVRQKYSINWEHDFSSYCEHLPLEDVEFILHDLLTKLGVIVTPTMNRAIVIEVYQFSDGECI